LKYFIRLVRIGIAYCAEAGGKKAGLGKKCEYEEPIRKLERVTRWNWGCFSGVGARGHTIWIDVHRDGRRFIVRADEKLTAFLELESAIRGCGELA